MARQTSGDDDIEGEAFVQRLLQSPTTQEVIDAAGKTVIVAGAAAAVKKAWDWAWTPNPNFKVDTFCGMGMDCGAQFINQYRKDSNAQSSSGNQGQQQEQSNTASPNPNDNDKKPFGAAGTKTTSTTIGSGKGWRVDVETQTLDNGLGRSITRVGKQNYCMIQTPSRSSELPKLRTSNF